MDLAARLLDGWSAKRSDPAGSTEHPDKQSLRLGQFCSQAAWTEASSLIARGARADASRSRLASNLLGFPKPALAIQMIAKGQVPDVLRQALRAGAKPMAFAQSLPCPPLFLALSNADEASARALLEAGADPNAMGWAWDEFSSRAKRRLKRSPLTAACCLAAQKLAFGPRHGAYRSPWEPLPAFDIDQALGRMLGCVRALLDAGADPNLADEARETPLCMAAAGDLPEFVDVLARAGADPDLPGFSERGFVGPLDPGPSGERLGGGHPVQWGKATPAQGAIFQCADRGLAALIHAGAALGAPERAQISELSVQRRDAWDFDEPDPTGPCPWAGALSLLDARELRQVVGAQGAFKAASRL